MKEVLITSSALILAVLLLRFLFRRSVSGRIRYALWLPVLLRLLLPVSFGSLSWSVAAAAQAAERTTAGELVSAVTELDVPRMSYERAYAEVTAENEARGTDAEELDDSELESRVYGRMRSGLAVKDVLRLLWYAGMGVAALLLLWRNLRFARLLRRTRVPLEGAESRYAVYLCDDVPSPCLFGLFRPAVYVTGAAAGDAGTLGRVIAHEETHARHLDPLWSLLRCLCLIVWWFDPLAWLAARCSRIDGELACDEGVLARLGEAERIPYGETLLALVPQKRSGDPLLSATTMTAGKRQMKDRIRRIAEHRRFPALALAAALTLAALLCAVTFSGGKQAEKAGEREAVRIFTQFMRDNDLFWSEDGGVWGWRTKVRVGEGEPERFAAVRFGPVFLPETEDVGETLILEIKGIRKNLVPWPHQNRDWWYLDYACEQNGKVTSSVGQEVDIRLDGEWYRLPYIGQTPMWDPSMPDGCISLMSGVFYAEQTEQIFPGHYRLVAYLRDWKGRYSLDVREFDLLETAEGFSIKNIHEPAELYPEEARIPEKNIRREDGSAWRMVEADEYKLHPYLMMDILEAVAPGPDGREGMGQEGE